MKGVWEVAVPKKDVTEPLGPGWERSMLNIPSPGTIASYRKGLYHVHETTTEWRVHLDRRDPKVHPVWHLIDDAPLLLMIGGTFRALFMDVRARNTKEELDEQKTTWRMLLLLGFALTVTGIFIGLDPFAFFEGIVLIVIPLVVVAAGVSILIRGSLFGRRSRATWSRILLGVGIIAIGASLMLLPGELTAGLIFLLLASWTFSSGIVSIKRLSRGRGGVPEGFFRILGIGILSLLLAGAILFAPDAMITILVEIVAFIIILLGIVLIGDGLFLKRRMQRGGAGA